MNGVGPFGRLSRYGTHIHGALHGMPLTSSQLVVTGGVYGVLVWSFDRSYHRNSVFWSLFI